MLSGERNTNHEPRQLNITRTIQKKIWGGAFRRTADGHLSEVGDDDVLVVGERRERLELVALEPRVPVRGEQALVLRHAQRLALLARHGPVLRHQLPAAAQKRAVPA